MSKKGLLDAVIEYGDSGYCPFHMPGHKRKTTHQNMNIPNPFSFDITEISGFDYLHNPQGLLKEAMQRSADIYGADESFYLVNGSTGGILSAVSGCVSRGGKILLSRNAHKSAYNAVFLNQLKTEYIYPQNIPFLGIQGGILPEDVEKKLSGDQEIEAVFLVSPTYDGIVSDIEEISRIVHKFNLPLIVDEAHGAHFPFGQKARFPVSAINKGADIVIQSLHKTLPALTQTAILHMNHKRLNQKQADQVKKYLSVYQSSSPSYVFLGIIEKCIAYMDKEGRNELADLSGQLDSFRTSMRKLKKIRIPGAELKGRYGVFDLDLSKLILSVAGCEQSGSWLSDKLREEEKIELELSAPDYALALCSLWDEPQDFMRLARALKNIDGKLTSSLGERNLPSLNFAEPDIVYPIFKAEQMNWQELPFDQCIGRVSGEYIYLYPPGIPCLVPGERVSAELVNCINKYKEIGLNVQGISDNSLKRLRVSF